MAWAAQLADQVQAAHAGQAQVDDRQVMVELAGLVQRLFGVGHGFDHVAAVGQAGKQVMAQQRLIFHHQQFHKALQSKSTVRQGDIIAALQVLRAQFNAIELASQVRITGAVGRLRVVQAQGLAPGRRLTARVFEATRWIRLLGFLVFSLPNSANAPSEAWTPAVALSMVNANISFLIAVMVLTSYAFGCWGQPTQTPLNSP